MPVSIPYTWSQDRDWVTVTADLPLASTAQAQLTAATLNVRITPEFVQWSHPPCMLSLDLPHAIDDRLSKATLDTGANNRVTIRLRKLVSDQCWDTLVLEGLSKSHRDARRHASIALAEERARARLNALKTTAAAQSKAEREAGWERERQRHETIEAAKNRERVVAIEEFAHWKSTVDSSDKREESKEQIDDNVRRLQPTLSDLPPRAPVAISAMMPPVRSTARITTTFSTTNPNFPSLPARESNTSPAAATTLSASSADTVSALLQVKDRADSLYKSGDLTGAIRAYGAILDKHEISEERFANLRCRIDSNRGAAHTALAMKMTAAAIIDNRTNARAAIECSRRALAMVEHLSEGDRQPMLNKLHARIANNAARLGDWDTALTQWRLVNDDSTMGSEAKIAIDRIERIQQLRNNGEFDSLMAEAQLSVASRDAETVCRLVSRAIELEPQNWSALSLRACAYQLLRDWHAALKDLTAALATVNDDTTATVSHEAKAAIRATLSLVHERRRELTDARTHLRDAIELSPQLSTDGRWQRCLERLNEELEALVTEKSIRSQLSLHDYAAARSSLTRLLDRHSRIDRQPYCPCPPSPACGCDDGGEAWTLRHCQLMSEACRCEMKLGQYERAAKLADNAINLFDQSLSLSASETNRRWRAQIAVKRGVCACRTGELVTGRKLFEAAATMVDDGSVRAELDADIVRIAAAMAEMPNMC